MHLVGFAGMPYGMRPISFSPGAALLMVAAIGVLVSPNLAASGADTAAQEVPQPVHVVDSGFAVSAALPIPALASNTRRLIVALVIENPNADLAAEGVTVQVRVRDGRGVPVVVRRFDLAQLLPGERRAVVGELVLPPPLAEDIRDNGRMDASLMGPYRWRRVGAVPRPTVELSRPGRVVGAAPVSGLGLAHADLASPDGELIGVDTPTADATVTNPFDVYIAGVDVSAVAFDGAGRIIGGGQRTVALAPLETASVSVSMVVSGAIDAIARLEVTAALPYIDLAPYTR